MQSCLEYIISSAAPANPIIRCPPFSREPPHRSDKPHLFTHGRRPKTTLRRFYRPEENDQPRTPPLLPTTPSNNNLAAPIALGLYIFPTAHRYPGVTPVPRPVPPNASRDKLATPRRSRPRGRSVSSACLSGRWGGSSARPRKRGSRPPRLVVPARTKGWTPEQQKRKTDRERLHTRTGTGSSKNDELVEQGDRVGAEWDHAAAVREYFSENSTYSSTEEGDSYCTVTGRFAWTARRQLRQTLQPSRFSNTTGQEHCPKVLNRFHLGGDDGKPHASCPRANGCSICYRAAMPNLL